MYAVLRRTVTNARRSIESYPDLLNTIAMYKQVFDEVTHVQSKVINLELSTGIPMFYILRGKIHYQPKHEFIPTLNEVVYIDIYISNLLKMVLFYSRVDISCLKSCKIAVAAHKKYKE